MVAKGDAHLDAGGGGPRSIRGELVREHTAILKRSVGEILKLVVDFR